MIDLNRWAYMLSYTRHRGIFHNDKQALAMHFAMGAKSRTWSQKDQDQMYSYYQLHQDKLFDSINKVQAAKDVHLAVGQSIPCPHPPCKGQLGRMYGWAKLDIGIFVFASSIIEYIKCLLPLLSIAVSLLSFLGVIDISIFIPSFVYKYEYTFLYQLILMVWPFYAFFKDARKYYLLFRTIYESKYFKHFLDIVVNILASRCSKTTSDRIYLAY